MNVSGWFGAWSVRVTVVVPGGRSPMFIMFALIVFVLEITVKVCSRVLVCMTAFL